MARPILRELAGKAHLDGGNGFTYGLMHAIEAARAARAERDLPATWRKMRKRKNIAWLKPRSALHPLGVSVRSTGEAAPSFRAVKSWRMSNGAANRYLIVALESGCEGRFATRLVNCSLTKGKP